MYKVLFHKMAVKYYESLDDKIAKKIHKAIEEMLKKLVNFDKMKVINPIQFINVLEGE